LVGAEAPTPRVEDEPIASNAKTSYPRSRFPPQVIQWTIWLRLRLTLRLGDIEDLLAERGATVSFDASEDKVERRIRNLAALAFVSPGVVEAIANGDALADIAVATLALELPHRWAEEERMLGAAQLQRAIRIWADRAS